jgi:creatinine amidohydrolase
VSGLRYEELSAEQALSAAKDPGSIFIIPVGSVEQHCGGPLGTDLMIAEGVAEAACEHLTSSEFKCYMMPAIGYGLSAEWSLAPGTVSLSLSTFEGLIEDVVRGLLRLGVKSVVIVNGHYGNSPAIEAALRELMRELPHDAVILQVNYWEALGIDVGHASEAEAEVMRALGYNVNFGRCGCEASPSPRGAKVYVRPPEAPSQLRSASRGELSKDYIGAAVSSAILEGLKASRSSRRPLP